MTGAPTRAATVDTGDFVRQAVGIEVATDTVRSLVPVELLVGVALRRNPKRAQLLVSNVLAKHVPTVPGVAIVAAELLGVLVGDALAPSGAAADRKGLFDQLARILQSTGERGAAAAQSANGVRDAAGRDDLDALRTRVAGLRSQHPEAVTIGYAETATGLGHLVAATIGSYYVHSTRHSPEGGRAFAGFEEEHSHATSHQLYPTMGDWLKPGGTVVLVDDELSTGRTVVNTISALHSAMPQTHWVVATLIDLRSPADRASFDTLAASLGTSVTVVALSAGAIVLPPDVAARAEAVLEAVAARSALPTAPGPVWDDGATPGEIVVLDVAVDPVRSARYGLDLSELSAGVDADATARRIADATRPLLRHGHTLVLGSEEFIALPLRVADHLDRSATATSNDTGNTGTGTVRFSTTTRSPIAAIDRPDYPIASAIGFRSHDLTADGFGPRFAYNLTRSGSRFATIVLLPEPGTDRDRVLGPGGIAEALCQVTDRVVVVGLPESMPDPAEWTPRT